MQEPLAVFDEAFKRTVEIGNNLVKDEKETEADAWDVADGLLAGGAQSLFVSGVDALESADALSFDGDETKSSDINGRRCASFAASFSAKVCVPS